jgi:hypothetical protein
MAIGIRLLRHSWVLRAETHWALSEMRQDPRSDDDPLVFTFREERWTMAKSSKSEPPFPVRGTPGGNRDPWSDDDTDDVRQDVVDADAHTADVAATWHREQRRERERREERTRTTGQTSTTP